LEIGVLEHDGRVHAAFGASVIGHNITAYTTEHEGRLSLTSWCGKVMLACRSEVVREFSDGSMALMFTLAHGRYIVGYALGKDGMLFRGELLTDCDEERARCEAMVLAEYWSQIDAEDEDDPWHGDLDENDSEGW
jgi:hypothetical protein